ncbi:MAG: hypothetical protein GY853_14555 [PVC group bacterium]|nr:hypothetical protein [PVC group bacterium]
MTAKEYGDFLANARNAHKKIINNIRRQYALSNNPYGIGDVISDRHGQVTRIEKIHVIPIFGEEDGVQCAYTGPKLKKDGTPYKRGGVVTINQNNINGAE